MVNVVKKICIDHNTTVQKLGKHLGKSKQYMSELGRGRIRLSYSMAIQIARYFETTPDALFLPYESNIIGQTREEGERDDE